MRKLISASKRKWVLGGILGFAAVALTTTGFATWIVGVQKTSVDNNLNVTVDTATNNSVVLTATLSDSDIALKETATVTNGKIVNTDGILETDKDALKIKFSSITIEWGQNYDFEFDQLELRFGTINASSGEVETKTYGTTTSSLGTGSGDSYKRTGSSWTYIECPSPLSISTSTIQPDKNTGIKTLTLSEQEFEFNWGTFFDRKSPAEFYNEKFKNVESLSTLAKASGEIQQELTAMKNYFEGSDEGQQNKVINVVLSLGKSQSV